MQQLLIAVTFICLALTRVVSAGFDYCSLGKDHTMCKYQKENTDGQCGTIFVRGVTLEDIKEIVDKHNTLRQRVATGNETNGPQPEAADMRRLMWDEELSTIAQRWAEQCVFEHDPNRNVERFKVGQNLAWSSISRFNPKKPPASKWSTQIQSWYDEVKDVDPSTVKKFSPPKKGVTIGHYTQMVWAQSRLIGCGYVSYSKDGRKFEQLYACNYGPAGNIVSKPIYTEGEACSQCPTIGKIKTTCSSLYEGLCAVVGDDDVEVEFAFPPDGWDKQSTTTASPSSPDGNKSPSSSTVLESSVLISVLVAILIKLL